MKAVYWVLIAVILLIAIIRFTPVGTILYVNLMNMKKVTEFRVDGDTLYMNGVINARTLDQFEKIYAGNPNLTRLVEMDVPGSFDDDTMIAFAYRLRALGFNTHLESNSKIRSGGVDLFLAGVERSLDAGAVIGVHSWSDGAKDAVDFPRTSPEHEMNRSYIEKMLGKDDFYWFTIQAALAEEIHLMTEQEIKSYGITTK